MSGDPGSIHRFGLFELDVRSGIVTRQGRRISLPRQSVVLLQLLVERPGEVVTREDVARALWPDGSHVDFEHGINNAAARLRRALGDPGTSPRFIETLPRVGYRFIAPAVPAPRLAAPADRSGVRLRWAPVLLAALLLFAAGMWAGALLVTPESDRARALAERSLIYTRMVLDGELPADLLYAAARNASTQALALDPDLADAHLAAGYVALWGRWDWTAADRGFRGAIARDPASARARQGHALWLAAQGRHAEALAQIARARDLDPSSIDVARDAALLSFVAGDIDGSIQLLRELLAGRPDDARAHELISEALTVAGHNAEAARHFYRFLVLADVAEQDAREATSVLAAGGMSSLVRRNLQRPSGKPLDRHGVPFKIASNHAIAGNIDDALTWLHHASAQRDSRLLLVNVHPRFEGVRDDPRFRSLLAVVGL